MIFAWVLVVFFGSNSSFAIPGIASEQECYRLGDAIQKNTWLKIPVDCHRYQLAR